MESFEDWYRSKMQDAEFAARDARMRALPEAYQRSDIPDTEHMMRERLRADFGGEPFMPIDNLPSAEESMVNIDPRTGRVYAIPQTRNQDRMKQMLRGGLAKRTPEGLLMQLEKELRGLR
jgi:hypothetical protein